jgi:hypothetical protein
MSLILQNEETAAMDQLMLSRDAVIDTLSERITKDIADALKYVDQHEVIGILELIKISIATQTLDASAKMMSDEIVGDANVH